MSLNSNMKGMFNHRVNHSKGTEMMEILDYYE